VKRLALFLLFVAAVIFVVVYGVATAPSKLSQVEIVVSGGKGLWKKQISQFVVSVVRPGQSISPDAISSLEESIEALPWVKEAEVVARGDKLIVKVKEAVPEFYVVFNGNFYLVGSGDFVLEKGKKRSFNLPVYYYKGKTSPFTIDKGFLKLKKTVKMEIKLVNKRIKELRLNGEPPQVTLTDAFVALAFKRGKVVVFLSPEERSWVRYQQLLSKAGTLKPGVYDFRFYDMVVWGGTDD